LSYSLHLQVAKHILAQMSRFCVYEEYGANYELVQRDVDDTQRAISAWSDFDRAIELLSVHVNPVQSREANKKKAMTVKDLLIKVSYALEQLKSIAQLSSNDVANTETSEVRIDLRRPVQTHTVL
jgi:hypothetical protein